MYILIWLADPYRLDDPFQFKSFAKRTLLITIQTSLSNDNGNRGNPVSGGLRFDWSGLARWSRKYIENWESGCCVISRHDYCKYTHGAKRQRLFVCFRNEYTSVV